MKLILLSGIIALFTLSVFAQWNDLNFPLSNEEVNTLIYIDDHMLVGTSYNQGIVYRTTNLGTNWEAAVSGLNGTRTNHLFCYNDNGNTIVYAATDSGGFYSSDYGSTWIDLDISASNQNIRTIFRTGEYILAGSDSGAYRSTNSGLSWHHVLIDSSGSRVKQFLSMDNILLTLLVKINGDVIYKSDDNGFIWTPINSDSIYVDVLSSLENLHGRLIFSRYGAILHSTDQGNSWERVGPPTWYPAKLKTYGDYLFVGSLVSQMYLVHKDSTEISVLSPLTPFHMVTALDVNAGLIVTAGKDVNTSVTGIWTRTTDDITSVDEIIFSPNQFILQQNYPNPFNPSTKITFTIPSVIASGTTQSLVTLKVYDILGNEVVTLVNEYKPAGSYEVEFPCHSCESRNLPSGIYFYQLKTESYVETKKMILMK